MKNFQWQSFENSSIMLKFHIFFVVMTLLPLGVLFYLYLQVHETGSVDLTADQLNTTLIIVVLGIISGYVAMRMMLKELIDVTDLAQKRMKAVMGPRQIQDLLKGNDNEIVRLTRTFGEISSRLEENVHDLELTKKTLASVLTRVGKGIAGQNNLDTFFDLIIETVTEALSGRKGLLLFLDSEARNFRVKTVFGIPARTFESVVIPVDPGPFSLVFQTRMPLVYTKSQNFPDNMARLQDILDFPIICAPLVLRDKVVGVIAVCGRRVGATFQEEEMAILMSLASQTAVAMDNSRVAVDDDKTYFETLCALAMAVEARDPYSRGHLERVGTLCVRIAGHLGQDEKFISDLRDAVKLYDVGKIGVSDDVLAKPAPLNAQEWAMMKRHPEISEGLLKPIPTLQPLCRVIRHHHERLDGSGYPDGLKGDQIPLASRILCVVDIYDSLTTDRAYHKAVHSQEALKSLREMGGQLDQGVVDALAAVIRPAA